TLRTLLLAFDGTMVINPFVYAKVPFDTAKDFAPVGKIGDIPLIMVANPKLGAKTLKEVIALSKTQPGGLSVGSTGTGSTAHLLVEYIKQKTGANLVHIPYKGANPAMVGTIGGETPLAIIGIVGVPQQIRSGTLHGVAVSSSQRAKLLPEVPTMSESGTAELTLNSWNGILAPARTPRPVLDRLNAELIGALHDAVFKEKLESMGFAVTAGSPENFGEQIRRDLTRYSEIVKTAGIKAD
ncbi:MAG: tripartite tricarboxylate transporter substrate-binding protein, partial [Pseudomonadota bacterium]